MSITTNDSGENKRTIVAVVLSVVVISAGFWVQSTFFPAPTPQAVPVAATSPAAAPSPVGAASSVSAQPVAAPVVSAKATPVAPAPAAALPAVEAPVAQRSYQIETDLLIATFTNEGGELQSLKLKKHKDKKELVDLVIPGTKDVRGFSVAFGTEGTAPMRELMNARMIDERTIEFSRVLFASVVGRNEPVPFTYKKVFSFRDGEYLFGLAVILENSENAALPLNQDGYAYTVSFGPKIGPTVEDMGSNTDIRNIYTFSGGKIKKEKQKNAPWSPANQPLWSAISGKYFSFIAVPQLVNFKAVYTASAPGANQTTSFAFSRPAVGSASQTDTWYFYFGPKTAPALAKYDYADRNGFGLQGLQLESANDTGSWLRWLEDGLKFLMNLFYKVIPNFGVAIILVTILVKVVFYPLTKKGSMASARMADLQPKMMELQAKYKNNPQKLNQEMAEFYKREGYNPMSGCLPMLIQFPLFIAMYNLFNTHFDLRGASFIPGWIPDLSLPESVWYFGGFKLPLLGWTDLRLLPIIYVGSQLLYGKFTQMPQTGQSATQMKIMMYGMPIIFFFILYNVPSGLLVYWIAQNVITIGQQIVINRHIKTHKAKVAAAKLGK